MQLELLESDGLEALTRLLSLPRNATLVASVGQTLNILQALITSSGRADPLSHTDCLPNNVLSAHHVEELLLLLLLCLLTDNATFTPATPDAAQDAALAAGSDASPVSPRTVDGRPIDRRQLVLRTLRLVSYQCKMSGVSRELLNTECLVEQLAVLLRTYSLAELMEPVVDCLLSLSDLNGGGVGGE